MRSASRLEGVSINTVVKLLVDAGEACMDYNDKHVVGIKGHRRIECDEIWSFIYAKEKNVRFAIRPPRFAGTAWTYVGMDVESRMVVSYWLAKNRDFQASYEFMEDLAYRLEDRPQISTDGLKSYVRAVSEAFGKKADYAQVVKQHGRKVNPEYQEPVSTTFIEKWRIQGKPNMEVAGTSRVERGNLTMRTGIRRFTRDAIAFSKRASRHYDMLHLFFCYYNFVRPHQTLGTTPAVAMGLAKRPRSIRWIMKLIDKNAPTPEKPGPKVGSKNRPRS